MVAVEMERAATLYPRERERERDERRLPRFGTFAPERRASDSPIAMACVRLVTFFPERPERSVPRFISRIDRSTFFEAPRL